MQKYKPGVNTYLTCMEQCVRYIKLCPALNPSITFLLTNFDHLSTAFKDVRPIFAHVGGENMESFCCFGRLYSTYECTDLSAVPLLGCSAQQ